MLIRRSGPRKIFNGPLSYGCSHSPVPLCLRGLYGPSPSMNGEPLEFSRVCFTHCSKSHYCRPQLRPDRCGIKMPTFVQLLPRLFQRSFDQMAGIRIEMFGNFVEGHDLTFPVRSGSGSPSPVVSMIFLACTLSHHTTGSESLSRSATSLGASFMISAARVRDVEHFWQAVRKSRAICWSGPIRHPGCAGTWRCRRHAV